MIDQAPEIGLVEWFRPPVKGEKQRAEAIIDFITRLDGLKYLRMDISWARCHEFRREVLDFYDWFFHALSSTAVKPVPNIMYTPPALGMGGCYASPPKDPMAYANFVTDALERWGDNFEYVELWNEPNALAFYRHDLDPGWRRFRMMIKNAAKAARNAGKKPVLGGMSHPSPDWLRNMFWDYALEEVEAIGFHSFPGTLPSNIGAAEWTTWQQAINQLNSVLKRQKHPAELWLTETGASSTLGRYEQLKRFNDALKAPISKLFWYAVQDFEGYMMEEAAGVECPDHLLNMGICARGANNSLQPKLLAEVWMNEGLEGVRSFNATKAGAAKIYL